MEKRANVVCPYCGKLQDIRLPKESMYPWVHPVDGICPHAPKTLKLYELRTARVFDVKPIEGEEESSEQCSCCSFCFHVLFFPIPPGSSWQEMEKFVAKHFDREMDQESVENSKTLVTKLIEKIPLRYPIASFLLAALMLSIYAIPVGVRASGLLPRFPILLVGLTLLFISMKYHSDKMFELKDSLQEVLRTHSGFDWLFARFRYYITGHPKARLNVANFTGFSFTVVWGMISLAFLVLKNRESIASLDISLLNLSRFIQSFPVEVSLTMLEIAFWGITCFVVGTAIWLGGTTTVITYWIGTHLPLRLNPSKKSGGCEPLGEFALGGIFPMAASGIIPLLFVSETQLSSSGTFLGIENFWLYFWVILLLAFSISLTSLFLISTYSIHEGMEREKKNLLAKASLNMNKIHALLEAPRASQETIFQASVANMQIGLNRRIDEIRVWPFNWSILFQLVFSAILPLLLFSLELALRG